MMLFTGRKWLLNGVELDAAGLAGWLDEAECQIAIGMQVGASCVFSGRGKLVRIQ